MFTFKDRFRRFVRDLLNQLVRPNLKVDSDASILSERSDYPVRAILPVTLTPAAQKFVLHWGEMGNAWGINRTMAQVHALLFVSPDALDAEEISKLLDVSRSNVSTSLREADHVGRRASGAHHR